MGLKVHVFRRAIARPKKIGGGVWTHQGGIFRCIALDLPCNRFHELPATLYVAQIISGVLMPTRFGCKTAKARQHEF